MVENRVLRKRARRQLGGGIFKPTWVKMLCALLILSFIESIGTMIYIGSILLMGPVTYAIERICANRAKNVEEVNFNRVFDGFTECFGSTFLLGILYNVFIVLWALLFVVPGIIKSYAYSMAFFIQQEQEIKDWKYCLDESKRLMHGNKWKLFCLDFSFFGWYLLGFMFFFVGIFFVLPYHQMARSNFFLELYYADANRGAEAQAEVQTEEAVEPFVEIGEAEATDEAQVSTEN